MRKIKNICILCLLVISGFSLRAFSGCDATPVCTPYRADPTVESLMRSFPEFCPGGCKDYYIIAANETMDIWYKGQCYKVRNLSREEVVIPTKNLTFYSGQTVSYKNKKLKCVGDFVATKTSRNDDCNRKMPLEVTRNCNKPIRNEIEGSCDPGCLWTHTIENTVWDTSTTPPTSHVTYTNESGHFGAGQTCAFTNSIYYTWVGNPTRNATGGEVTNNEHRLPGELNLDYERNCTSAPPQCCGVYQSWSCRTCGPGPGPGKCTYTGGEINTLKPGEPGGPPPSSPQRGGGTTVSH